MLRVDKVIKPWKESGMSQRPPQSLRLLERDGLPDQGPAISAWSSVFPAWITKALIARNRSMRLKRLEAALKAFGPGFHVYQYLFKSNRPRHNHSQKYDDPIVAAPCERQKFFEAKRDHLYQVEIFYCILLEGSRSKTGVGAAFSQLFRDPAGAIGELKAQFTNDNMKTLLRSRSSVMLPALDQRVQAFARQLADFMQIEVLNPSGAVHFFPPVA